MSSLPPSAAESHLQLPMPQSVSSFSEIRNGTLYDKVFRQVESAKLDCISTKDLLRLRDSELAVLSPVLQKRKAWNLTHENCVELDESIVSTVKNFHHNPPLMRPSSVSSSSSSLSSSLLSSSSSVSPSNDRPEFRTTSQRELLLLQSFYEQIDNFKRNNTRKLNIDELDIQILAEPLPCDWSVDSAAKTEKMRFADSDQDVEITKIELRRTKPSCNAEQSKPKQLLVEDVDKKRIIRNMNKRMQTSEKNCGLLLWQFIMKQLLAESHGEQCVIWLNKSRGVFEIRDKDKLAECWGECKLNRCMTFEKLNRSLRQYYKEGGTGVLQKTGKQRHLVYQFNFGHKSVQQFLKSLVQKYPQLNETIMQFNSSTNEEGDRVQITTNHVLPIVVKNPAVQGQPEAATQHLVSPPYTHTQKEIKSTNKARIILLDPLYGQPKKPKQQLLHEPIPTDEDEPQQNIHKMLLQQQEMMLQTMNQTNNEVHPFYVNIVSPMTIPMIRTLPQEMQFQMLSTRPPFWLLPNSEILNNKKHV